MAKIRKFLLMFQGVPNVNFCELEWDEFQQVESNPEQYQIFVIQGASATIIVASEDKTLGLAEARQIAIKFVFGQYDVLHIDLNELKGSLTRGQPLINPPY